MRTLELENYGVLEMGFTETISTEGGKNSIGSWGPWGLAIWAAEEIISNWDDIKAGFNDATNHKPYNYQHK